MALGGVAWGARAGCWHLHPHQVLSAEDFAPDLPPGALVSVAWRLDGAGRVVGGALPRGNPHGGAWGKRVLRGEGIWPAEMYPPGREITAELDLVEPGSAADPARIVVHGPLHDIPGLVDQPGLPTAGWTRMVTRLRRDSRRRRIQAGGGPGGFGRRGCSGSGWSGRTAWTSTAPEVVGRRCSAPRRTISTSAWCC